MSDQAYELNIYPAEGDTFSATIHCPAFADSESEFPSVSDALDWARDRTERVSDPMTYVA